jgi:uncharacterized protein (TIGR00730 family)
VDGFERLDKYGPCISIFGSARTKETDPIYQLTVEVAQKLTDAGFGIITGGGPGIMEAGNRGAKMNNGISVGLNIDLPFEQYHNPYLDSDKLLNYRFFFVRKVMFVKYAQGFVVMPGGFGTMDEVFEVLTLVQTQRISPVPIIFMGVDYWKGLMDWIKSTLLEKAGNINAQDLDLFHITDSSEKVVAIINDFYRAGKGGAELAPKYKLE